MPRDDSPSVVHPLSPTPAESGPRVRSDSNVSRRSEPVGSSRASANGDSPSPEENTTSASEKSEDE